MNIDIMVMEYLGINGDLNRIVLCFYDVQRNIQRY